MTDDEPTRPQISVVVPTHNRSPYLPMLLAALGEQRGVGCYEVLIVDDCSTDATEGVLTRLASRANRPIRLLRTVRNSGPAAARNLGWRAARAPWIAFTDDDCVPDAQWLDGLTRATNDADLVQGRTEVDELQANGSGPFARSITVDSLTWKFETCNIAYRRDLLERLGGFDERFPAPFGEDVDLGWRAVNGGARVAWAPDSLVLHRVETHGSLLRDWMEWIRYAWRCEYAAPLVKAHPGIRARLPFGLLYKTYHAPTLLALLGLPLLRRSPATAVAALFPWTFYRTFVERRAVRKEWHVVVLALAFVVDATEVAATLTGAWRYRTLLL